MHLAFRSMLHNNSSQPHITLLNWIWSNFSYSISPLALACQMSIYFKWILNDRRHLEFYKCRTKTTNAIYMRRFVFHYCVHFYLCISFHNSTVFPISYFIPSSHAHCTCTIYTPYISIWPIERSWMEHNNEVKVNILCLFYSLFFTVHFKQTRTK